MRARSTPSIARRMLLSAFLAIAAPFLGPSADAGEKVSWTPVPDAVIDATVKAARDPDPAVLTRHATLVRDPWFVADALIGRGAKAEALALAKASDAPRYARLAAYVELRWDADDDAKARAAATDAERALIHWKFDEALALTGAHAPTGDDLVSIRLLRARASALFALGRSDEGFAAAADCAERLERIGAMVALSDVVGQAGTWKLDLGDLRGARARFERCVALREAAGFGALLVSTRNLLAMTLESLGEYAAARTQAEKALAVGEKGPRKADTAASLGILATVCDSLADYRSAATYAERALALAVESGDKYAEAVTLGVLFTIEMQTAPPAKAYERLRKARAAFAQLAEAPALAALDVAECVFERRLGNHVRAMELAEAATKSAKASGDQHQMAAAALEAARCAVAVGDADRAQARYALALSLGQKTGSRLLVAQTLEELGARARAAEELDQALEYYGRARRSFDDLGNRAASAGVAIEIAELLGRTGKVAEGLTLANEALAVAEEVGSIDRRAQALVRLGELERRSGERPKAIATLERAIALAERGRLRDLLAAALGELAATHLDAGSNDLAVATARRAVAIVSSLVEGHSDEGGARSRALHARTFDVGFLAAARLRHVEDATYFLEVGRSGSLLAALDNRPALLEAEIPAALADELRLARADDLSAQAAFRFAVDAGERTAVVAAAKAADAAQARLADVRERVQRSTRRTAPVLYPQPAPLEELRALLREGDALVTYAMPGDADAAAHAVVATRKDARVVALGPVAAVRAACDALDASDRTTSPDAAIAAVHKLLVEPLGLAATTVRVLVSPDAELTQVPFALLFRDGATARPVVLVPSGTTLATLALDGTSRGAKVLALGDPAYDAEPDVRGDAGPLAVRSGAARLVRLPATRDEAKAIGDTVLLDRDATIARLREALAGEARWRAVHLACHGLARRDRGMMSSLALTPAGGDGGILTAAEVFATMRVPADLVVLSACETNRGTTLAGEGLFGPPRAFLFAGAPRVIVSLWKVDDEATRALMTAFYERYKAGVPAATALRDAQAKVAAEPKWRHPGYWAAWVLWGLPD